MAAQVKPARNLYGAITDRYPSVNIWGDFPMEEHLQNPGLYWHWWEDFHNIPLLTTATAQNKSIYFSYIDSGNTIAQLATKAQDGVMSLATDATDNDGPVVTMAGNAGTSVMISDTAGDATKLWYESRWQKSSVTDNQAAIFNGITEEARGVDDGVLIDDTGVLADIDHIGFNVAHDNGEELNFAYTKAGQTDTELLANCATLVAATYIKTGFKYDPDAPTARRVAAYLNNVEQSTYVTGALIAAATFPDGEELTWTVCLKNGEGTATSYNLDWFRIAQKMRAT